MIIKPVYDPIFDPIDQQKEAIFEKMASTYVNAIDTLVDIVYEYPKQIGSVAATIAGRFSPPIAALNLFHFGYRGAVYLEQTWPGFWRRRYEEFMDAGRYYGGNTDWDTYYDGTNWRDWHDYEERRTTGKPYRPIYPTGDLF